MQLDIVRASSDARHVRQTVSSHLPHGAVVAEPPSPLPVLESVAPRRFSSVLAQASDFTSPLHAFIFGRAWIRTGVGGIPWALLMACYEIETGQTVSAASHMPLDPLQPDPPLKKLVDAFRRQFMQVVRASMHPQDRHAFVSTLGGSQALKAMGFYGTCNSLSVWPEIPTGTLARACVGLMEFRRGLPHDWKQHFVAGGVV
eukprot:314378-Alexandrium_andersonii.AAC.1